MTANTAFPSLLEAFFTERYYVARRLSRQDKKALHVLCLKRIGFAGQITAFLQST